MKLVLSKNFKQLSTFCILLGVFPVLLLGWSSYLVTTNVLQEKVQEGNLQLLEQTKRSVEQPLQLLENSMLQYLVSSGTIELVKDIDLPQDYSKIRTGVNGLNNFILGQLKIEELMLVSSRENLAISNYEFFYLNQLESYKKLKELDADARYSIWLPWQGALSTLPEKGGADPQEKGVALVRKISSTFSENFPYLLAKISSTELCKYLSESELGNVMILDEALNVIAHTDVDEIGRNLAATVYGEQIGGDTKIAEGTFRTEINQQMYEVNFNRSSYNGWIYVSTTNLNVINRKSRTIGAITLGICLFLVGATIVFSVIVSNRFYSPVHKLYQELSGEKELKNLKNENIDEIDYLQNNLQSLRMSHRFMEDQISSQEAKLEMLGLIELLFDYSFDKKEPECFKKWKTQNFLGLLIVNIDTLQNSSFEDDAANRLFYIIDNIFRDLVPEECWMSSVWIQQDYIVLLGGMQNLEEAFNAFLMSHAQLLIKTVEEKLHFIISIGISKPFHGVDDAGMAYNEVRNVLKYKLLVGNQAILNSDMLANSMDVRHNASAELVEELSYTIRSGNEQKSIELVKNYLDNSLKNNLNYIEFQADVNFLITGLLKVIYDNKWFISDILSEEDYLFEKLTEFHTGEELENWFIDSLIRPLIKKIQNKWDNKEIKISDEVIKIIQTHYMSDISLELCAQRLNYSANYVGRIFRQETGSTFTAYLAEYRIEKAKELLCESDMKIQDIAELLRYGNAQNFIRYFKKHERMTPGQYRNKKNGTGIHKKH